MEIVRYDNDWGGTIEGVEKLENNRFLSQTRIFFMFIQKLCPLPF